MALDIYVIEKKGHFLSGVFKSFTSVDSHLKKYYPEYGQQ